MKFLRNRALFIILADYSFLWKPINLLTRNIPHPLAEADELKDYSHYQTIPRYSQITIYQRNHAYPLPTGKCWQKHRQLPYSSLPDYSHTTPKLVSSSVYSKSQNTLRLLQPRLLQFSLTDTDCSHYHTGTHTIPILIQTNRLINFSYFNLHKTTPILIQTTPILIQTTPILIQTTSVLTETHWLTPFSYRLHLFSLRHTELLITQGT